MAKARLVTKAKEPVHIRFKELKNGNKSIYLDIYHNGRRRYEFLRLNLVPANNPDAKIQNENTLAAANAIKSRRIIEIINGTAGIRTDSDKGRILLRDWLRIHIERKKDEFSRATRRNYHALDRKLKEYDPNIRMKDIDREFCMGFLKFLRGCDLMPGTVLRYFKSYTALLNAAVRDRIIPENPTRLIESCDKPKTPESSRAFLTIDEVKRLIETPCRRQDYKDAFLFSCFCGLRWSDIRKLKWGEIEEQDGKYYANIMVKKTKVPLYLPLNHQALNHLPSVPCRKPEQEVFARMPRDITKYGNVLTEWAKSAGIHKKVTFHVARHTFATTSLTLGADLYTTSKLLGHKNVTTTQIYAKIVNSKKDEAVALFDKAF